MGKEVKHKALSKLQIAKIKSIRLFHAFCFCTYGTKHSVLCFLLLIWKDDGKSVYVNLQLFYFFSQVVCTNFPTGSYFGWPVLCLARSHTTLHASTYAWYLLP